MIGLETIGIDTRRFESGVQLDGRVVAEGDKAADERRQNYRADQSR